MLMDAAPEARTEAGILDQFARASSEG